jgi:hypothetical protein
VGKAQFLLMYRRARVTAFTAKNIKSAWENTGLVPFNPQRVLGQMQKLPPAGGQNTNVIVEPPQLEEPCTPVTAAGFACLRARIEQNIPVDHVSRSQMTKAFADRDLLLDDNSLLREQNNKTTMRALRRRTVLGRAKVMSYDDIVTAENKQQVKGKGKGKRKGKPSVEKEIDRAQAEIEAMRLEEYCHILRF